MGRHDTHSGAQPDDADLCVLEARMDLREVEHYDHADDLMKAMWLTEAAKSTLAILFSQHRYEPHLLLDGVTTIQREGDTMVARFTPNQS